MALPVLLRRAGWHPAAIIALSVAMRWPFHGYHGAWSSLPWAAIWGGAYCAAFLYLRRLLPLIGFHAFWDIQIMSTEAWGQAGTLLSMGVGLALAGWLVTRLLRDRWRRLDACSQRPTLTEAWYLFRTDRGVVLLLLLSAGLTTGAAVVVAGQPDRTLWLAVAVLAVATCATTALMLWSFAVHIDRDDDGAIRGAVAWADNRRPGVIDVAQVRTIDVLDAVRVVAEHEPSARTIMVSANRADAAKLAAKGYPVTRTGRIGHYAVIPRNDALAL